MSKLPNRLTNNLTASEILASQYDPEVARKHLSKCFAAIEQFETEVHAFASIDKTVSVDGVPKGLLAGIPIGIKDVIESASLPTEFNSPLYEHHQAARDAACIAVLKAQGAVVLGKTATVEFASLGRVAATRNPHNLAHTPGGTSSGSAAAVAASSVWPIDTST